VFCEKAWGAKEAGWMQRFAFGLLAGTDTETGSVLEGLGCFYDMGTPELTQLVRIARW